MTTTRTETTTCEVCGCRPAGAAGLCGVCRGDLHRRPAAEEQPLEIVDDPAWKFEGPDADPDPVPRLAVPAGPTAARELDRLAEAAWLALLAHDGDPRYAEGWQARLRLLPGIAYDHAAAFLAERDSRRPKGGGGR